MTDKWTPLHVASRDACLQTVINLVKNGAEIDATTNDGRTALLLAADGMRDFSSNVRSQGNVHSHLLLSAENKYHRIVKVLIKAGANLNCCNSNQWTLLHFASRNGWRGIVQSILKKDVDIDAKTEGGNSPLLVAAKHGYKDIVTLLLNAGANINGSGCITALDYASKNGWLEIVQSLLKKGADINWKSHGVDIPLLVAAKKRHKGIVELLINSGAYINRSGFSNYSVLHYAARNGWLEIMQSLLINGVDIQVKTDSGYTPVLIAAYHEHRDIVELLIHAGANIHDSGVCNRTLLHHASQNGWLEIVQYLLKKGADINRKSNSGSTPLLLACNCYETKIVEHLINAGADVNIESNKGISPLSDLIRQSPNIQLVRLLIESGAYLTSIDYERILKDSSLKEGTLQDIELCSQSIINKFNYKDLPELYKQYTPFYSLPRIERMRIMNANQVTQETVESVKHQIQGSELCNVLEACPIDLKMLSVKSFLGYCKDTKKQEDASNQMKSSAESDNQQTPKKLKVK